MVDFLSSPLSHHLFLTLVHFLWQGFLVGFVYCLVIANLSAKSVEFRYRLSLLALLGMALCPVVTFAMLRQSPPAAASIAVSATTTVADIPTEPVVAQRMGAATPTAERNRPQGFKSEEQSPSHPMMESGTQTLAALQPYGLLIWWAGVLVSGARLSAGIFGLFWIRSDRRELPSELQRYSQTVARRLGVRSADVFASSRTPVACVAGLLKPVVLLPTSWLSELPPDLLEAVIAHELAHVRRFDTWVNLLQRVLETLLFYHPMVWWLSNRVRYERELCCDKLAVDATGDRRIYIRALEQVGRLQVHGSRTLPPAFTGDRKMNLLTRVQHILCVPRRDREPSWVVGLAVMLSALAVGLATGIITDSPTAFAQQREGDRSAEAEAERRFSPEAERGDRRSPEAERGDRRSPEAERGDRRSPEADARREKRDPLDRFQPQSDREAALFRMIIELKREVAELRREVGQAKYQGDREQPRFRDEGPRDQPQVDPAHRKLQKIFLSRDKNRDQKLNRDEFNSLFEGGPRNDVFNAADRNDDDGLSFEEFVEHRLGRRPAREGDQPSARPRERDRD